MHWLPQVSNQLACPCSFPLQACNHNTVYCVPLYDVLGDNTVEYIIEHSGGLIG